MVYASVCVYIYMYVCVCVCNMKDNAGTSITISKVINIKGISSAYSQSATTKL
jgi:hypothetical protein